MCNIYDCEQKVFIKGKTADFCNMSMWEHLRALTADEVMNYEKRLTFTNFNCLWDFVNGDNSLYNVYTGKTLFGQRYIQFNAGYRYEDVVRVKEKGFTEVVIWFHCKERNTLTMKSLASRLTADDFIKYLHSKGIKTIAVGE